jgi:hypothetical protein
MRLESSAFEPGGRIPVKYTCDGENVSPPFKWQGVPEAAQSLVMICDDPDAPAGVFSHWVLYNLPTSRNFLEEGLPSEAQLDRGGTQGRNDFGEIGYGGPCPPRSETHRYFFRFYALDEELDLPSGATRQQALDQIEEHTLDSTEYIGAYARSS